MNSRSFLLVCIVLAVGLGAQLRSWPQDGEPNVTTIHEYITIRWDGKENTHVIYANGNVEFLREQFEGIRKPSRADDRAFFLTLAMNALAAKGYKIVARTDDAVLMGRPAVR